MGKKIFEVYLAKEDVPNNEAYAKLDLPASPWELWDAMEKVRLNEGEQLYMEIEDYEAFGYLAPYLDGLDISLIELNDLAALLSPLDEVQEAAFEGLFSMEVQRKVNANGGVITLQDLRDLAVSARTDCYHVVDAADDALPALHAELFLCVQQLCLCCGKIQCHRARIANVGMQSEREPEEVSRLSRQRLLDRRRGCQFAIP